MKFVFLIIVIEYLVYTNSEPITDKLDDNIYNLTMVQAVIRHGIRNNMSNPDLSKYGERMLFLLGKEFRYRYIT